MKILNLLIERALDGVDALFDAIATVRCVLVRGAFAPDAKSYRGARYAMLSANAVLVQEIVLNAADHAEARKAIALDPENHLPLAPDTVVFDLAGPLQSDSPLRGRPERGFILGVARKDALTAARESLPLHRRSGVEAFTYAPPAAPGSIFIFGDDAGARRRRLRRALTAIAMLTLVWAGADALDKGQAALARASEAANTERVEAERDVRLAERRASAAEAALAAATAEQTVSLRQTAQILTRLALHMPAETQPTSATLERGGVRLNGQTYDADSAELQLRRAFERDTIVFSAELGATPASFSVQLTPTAEASP